MIKKSAGVVIMIVGLFWIISPLVLGYPGKSQAVDNLTNSFRPVFGDAGERQVASDIAMINNFAAGFQGKAVPALATQLHTTPAALISTIGKQFPDDAAPGPVRHPRRHPHPNRSARDRGAGGSRTPSPGASGRTGRTSGCLTAART